MRRLVETIETLGTQMESGGRASAVIDCPGCAAARPDGPEPCPHCGFAPVAAPPPVPALAGGTRLCGGAFTVGRQVAPGGSSLIYMGSDTRRSSLVAVKEFFPSGCAREGKQVIPPPGWRDQAYTRARKRFLDEGRTLVWLNHPG